MSAELDFSAELRWPMHMAGPRPLILFFLKRSLNERIEKKDETKWSRLRANLCIQ